MAKEKEDILKKFNEQNKNAKHKDILNLLEFLEDEDLLSAKGISFYHKFLKEKIKSGEKEDKHLNKSDGFDLEGGLLPADEDEDEDFSLE